MAKSKMLQQSVPIKTKRERELQKALDQFPKIVRAKKMAHLKNEKILKQFMGMAKKLAAGKLKPTNMKK